MPWMPAIVCVVQNGSSVRTSACSTARNTFSCACTDAIPNAALNTAAATIRRPSGEAVMTFPPRKCPDSEVRETLAARSHANFGIKGTLAMSTLSSAAYGFEVPRRDCHELIGTSNPPSDSRSMGTRDFNVRGILAGQAPKDVAVTVKGWVRTRRDSKAGISFLHLSDGSAFHPVQVVAPNTLP